MSGFQIPGLGQAKPNETLPPLPADMLAAAANVAATEAPSAPSEPNDTSRPKQNKTEESNTNSAAAASQAATEADAMVIDQPDSPSSLTGALEAAIGGLGHTDNAPEQVQPPTGQVALQNDQGEHPEWEIDSSPYESSSDSSSSDSSDDDSDNQGYEPLGVEETARLLMEAEGGSDDEGDRGKGSSAAQLRTKNEMAEEIVAKPDITITEDMKIEELGTIEHMVDNIMLIKAITPGEYQVLDTGSVLCTAERVVIGAVAETIGKVLQPMYTVYFSSEQEIKDSALEVGTKVFYPVDHASYVFTQPLKNMKGSDASNLHDEEVGDDEMEFSDDEKEAEYKRALKQKKKDKWKSKNEGKVSSGSKEAHPLSQELSADGGLNYDDDDGPYKPLTRPPGFGDGPMSNESYEPAPRSGFRRGRGGDVRARGSRGRGAGRGSGRGGYGNASRDGYSLPPQGSQPHSQQKPGPSPPPTPQAPVPPAVPGFGFQFPAWPQSPAAQGQYHVPPPPPPPGWPAQGQGQAGASNAFVNPAFVAALMSQMQQQQSGQQGWASQQQPSPNGGQGQ